MIKIRKSEAVVFTEPGKVAIQEFNLAEPGPEDVLVEIEYSSISVGTDRWALLGKLREPGKPLMTPFPHVPGYQAAGTVKAIGEKVTMLELGDRVFTPGSRIAKGWPGSCWGGHVRHHLTHQKNALKLPDNVSTRQAAGLLLSQVGYNGASRPNVKRGDAVIVIGDGLVGQYAGQVFRHRGAHVILAGRHSNRLDLAKKYSADEVVNSKMEDFPAWVRKKYPQGVPVVAETASQIALVRMAINLLEYSGQLVLLGYYPEGECLLDIHWVRERETTVHCPNASTPDRLKQTLDLVARGAMHLQELVTHTFPFREAPKAYKLIEEKSASFLGVILDWKK
ncbi:MAG: zinc-binding alcohol dehydrogenase [Verrucomicrobia bacterium]|nr:zinc-binding alcohol dehydrogenase [Verrucomicrobiota bacterium]